MTRSGAPPGHGAARSIVPPTPRADLDQTIHPQDTSSAENNLADDFAWLANLSTAEYESMRHWLARQYRWRVATLDRLYREARRKAGAAG